VAIEIKIAAITRFRLALNLSNEGLIPSIESVTL
jgi:hypothetical protein